MRKCRHQYTMKSPIDLSTGFGLFGELFPSSLGRLCCHFRPLSLGHGFEAALPADLTALAPDGRHVLGDVGRRGAPGDFGRFPLWGWNLTSGNCYSPSSELVWIARALAFADGHCIPIMPQTGC